MFQKLENFQNFLSPWWITCRPYSRRSPRTWSSRRGSLRSSSTYSLRRTNTSKNLTLYIQYTYTKISQNFPVFKNKFLCVEKPTTWVKLQYLFIYKKVILKPKIRRVQIVLYGNTLTPTFSLSGCNCSR